MTTTLNGATVGPLAHRGSSPSGSLPTDVGQGYDFAIGSLPFRLAITDETPYRRETAQFRKDQFDAAPVPGEQALDGWWLRSQSSFHRGAGLRYYEVLDGEGVLNRYSKSEGVKITTLGEVSLLPSWTNSTATFASPARAVFVDGKMAVNEASTATVKHGTLSGDMATYTTSDAANVVAMAGSDTTVFVATASNKIERVQITSGSPASGVVYTHTQAISGLWHAKARLWFVDALGDWYAIADAPSGALPVAVADSDKAFSAGVRAGTWHLAETPGTVVLAAGKTLYSVNVSASDGSIPTIKFPVVAAQLPNGETVKGLTYYLGSLVLATTLGVRVALVDTDNGSVVLGPHVFEWDGGGGTMARVGSRVAVLGEVDGSATPVLFQVHLDQPTGDLVYAWSRFSQPGLAASSNYGVLTADGSRLVAWSQATSNIKYSASSGSLAASGYLQTGAHRFGTLEPKQFHSVRVRLSGTGGSIVVARVDASGTETSLATLSISNRTSEEVTLRLSEPVESLSLKFTLNRDASDATKGPVLHGYQLRALPAPDRQEILKVPLLLQDTERNRHGLDTGRAGLAYTRFKQLKDLESDVALVNFRDYRTGEAGQAYIDGVSFQSNTPFERGSGNFGGIAYVDLRVVS